MILGTYPCHIRRSNIFQITKTMPKLIFMPAWPRKRGKRGQTDRSRQPGRPGRQTRRARECAGRPKSSGPPEATRTVRMCPTQPAVPDCPNVPNPAERTRAARTNRAARSLPTPTASAPRLSPATRRSRSDSAAGNHPRAHPHRTRRTGSALYGSPRIHAG